MKFIKGTPIEVREAILNYQKDFECENDESVIKEYCLSSKFNDVYDLALSSNDLNEEKMQFCLNFLNYAEDVITDIKLKKELSKMYKNIESRMEFLETQNAKEERKYQKLLLTL
jgi:hypothetical protein